MPARSDSEQTVSREEIEALVRSYCLDPDQNARVYRYVDEKIRLEGRLRHAEANNAQLARHRRTDDIDPKSRALVESLRDTVARQDEEIRRLKGELAKAYENNRIRNLELDALHYVWCDGGCQGGAHRFDSAPEQVTAEVVKLAQRNTERLARWFRSRMYRQKRQSEAERAA